jgi:CHAD domain-containing protein
MNSDTSRTIDQALRTILGDQLNRIESCAERVITDSNPEDIHDLRVATRRTRTILGQVPGIFPKTTIKCFRQGFRNIGNVTGHCRDLDVWLEAIAENQDSSSTHDGLGPLEDLVRRLRDIARAQVSSDLRKPWFSTLLHQWRTFLETPPETLSKKASQPTAPVATTRILKAHQRLLKHGHALPAEPHASEFHRLRIDGKKLRYLLEFFGAVFDLEQSHRLIEDLKGLQDSLGGINDREIQLVAIDGLSENQDPILTIAIERHRRFLNDSLADFQAGFKDEFGTFSSPEVTRSLHHLLRFDPDL